MLYQGKKVIDMGNFIEKLTIGDIIPIQLKTKNGVVLVEEGRTVTQRIKQTLQRLYDDGEIEHIELEKMDPKDADKVLNMGRKPMDTINNRVMNNTKKKIKEILKNFNSSTIENLKEDMQEVVNLIAESTQFQHNVERRYVQQADDISSHTIAVSCFSILLSKLYNKKLRDSNIQISKDCLINLEDVALAAVFKDIGKSTENFGKLPPKLHIPEDIQDKIPEIKNVPLDKYDENYSSVYSYLLLGNISEQEVNDDIRTMVLLSNEPEEGKGCLKVTQYSSTQTKSSIIGGKIIHLCDIYDKLMENTIKQGHSLEEVVAAMLQYTVDGTINKELGNLFMSNVPLYPINTRVKLSDGRIARVIENNYREIQKNYNGYEICKPTVEVIEPDESNELINEKTESKNEIIELKDSTTTTIASVVTESMYADLVRAQIESMKDRTLKQEQGDIEK